MKTDISIQGKGFYAITAHSGRAHTWMEHVEGFDGATAYSDNTASVHDIAVGAFEDGLTVTINGRRIKGRKKLRNIGSRCA